MDGNNESLFRPVLEISTYFQILDHNKFWESFDEFKNKPEIKKAVLLTEGCKANQDVDKLNERTNLKKLIDKLQIDIFVLKYEIINLQTIKVKINNNLENI